jgi:hypothetical protein
MTARDEAHKDAKCLICGDERISFPSKLEITTDAFENYTATILETKEVPSEEAWIPLAGFGAAGNVNTAKTFLVCPKCAEAKELVTPEPSPAAAPDPVAAQSCQLETPKSAIGTEEDIPF